MSRQDTCQSIHHQLYDESPSTTLSDSRMNHHNLAKPDSETLRIPQNLAEKHGKAVIVVEGQVRKQPRGNQRCLFSFAPGPFFWPTVPTRRSLLPRRFPPPFVVRTILRLLCVNVFAGNTMFCLSCRRRVVVVAADRPTFSLLGRLQQPADHNGRRACRVQGTNSGADVLLSVVLMAGSSPVADGMKEE